MYSRRAPRPAGSWAAAAARLLALAACVWAATAASQQVPATLNFEVLLEKWPHPISAEPQPVFHVQFQTFVAESMDHAPAQYTKVFVSQGDTKQFSKAKIPSDVWVKRRYYDQAPAFKDRHHDYSPTRWDRHPDGVIELLTDKDGKASLMIPLPNTCGERRRWLWQRSSSRDCKKDLRMVVPGLLAQVQGSPPVDISLFTESLRQAEQIVSASANNKPQGVFRRAASKLIRLLRDRTRGELRTHSHPPPFRVEMSPPSERPGRHLQRRDQSPAHSATPTAAPESVERSEVRYIDHYMGDLTMFVDKRLGDLSVFLVQELDRIEDILVGLLDSVANVSWPPVLERVSLAFDWTSVLRTQAWFAHYLRGMEGAMERTATLAREGIEDSIRGAAQGAADDLDVLRRRLLTPREARMGGLRVAMPAHARMLQRLVLGTLKRVSRSPADNVDGRAALEQLGSAAATAAAAPIPVPKLPPRRAGPINRAMAAALGAAETAVGTAGNATALVSGAALRALPPLIRQYYGLFSMHINATYLTRWYELGIARGTHTLTVLDAVALLAALPAHYAYIAYTGREPFSAAEIAVLPEVRTPLEYVLVWDKDERTRAANAESAAALTQQRTARHYWLLQMAWTGLSWVDTAVYRRGNHVVTALARGAGAAASAPVFAFFLGALFLPMKLASSPISSAADYDSALASIDRLWIGWWATWMAFTVFKSLLPLVDVPLRYVGPKMWGAHQFTPSDMASYDAALTHVDAVVGGAPALVYAVILGARSLRSAETGPQLRAAHLGAGAWLASSLGYVARAGGLAWSGTAQLAETAALALFGARVDYMIRHGLFNAGF